MLRKIYITLTVITLIGCGADKSSYSTLSSDNKESQYPKTWEERQLEEMGKLTGEDGIVLLGSKGKSSQATEGINVNSYLWRASLDIVHKMPLISADSFSGVIITDWYRIDNNVKERFKLNIYIISSMLQSDAIRVAAFKQTLKSNGQWSDPINNEKIANEIENRILLKARAIKFKLGK